MSRDALRSLFGSTRKMRCCGRSAVCLVIMMVMSLSIADGLSPAERKTPATVTDSMVGALIVAIQDEIYTNGYEKAYVDVGPGRVPLYVNPKLENDMLWMIYKLMPHGEVFRGAFLSADPHLIILAGDPHDGFPPTQGAAMRTVYLPDDDVIRMKTTWRRTHFSVKLSPTREEVQEAKRRQEQRARLKDS
jgi:hypothetical protein